LRPEHSVDGSRAGGGLGLDGCKSGLRAEVRACGKAVAGDSALWVSLVCGHATRDSMDPDSSYKANPKADYISAMDAVQLARTYGGQIEWDAADRTAWFYFYRGDLREWIFFTDIRTFR